MNRERQAQAIPSLSAFQSALGQAATAFAVWSASRQAADLCLPMYYAGMFCFRIRATIALPDVASHQQTVFFTHCARNMDIGVMYAHVDQHQNIYTRGSADQHHRLAGWLHHRDSAQKYHRHERLDRGHAFFYSEISAKASTRPGAHAAM